MYVWADGIHLTVRLDEAKACVLVLVGVRADGSKELVALRDGYRESGESWADLLRDCARRGMHAPVLAVVFQLVESARKRWRAVHAPHPVAPGRAGARLERGLLLERPTTATA